ncbi:MAG: hypothetical protein ACP5JH_01885 [Bacteroidota bacterium]
MATKTEKAELFTAGKLATQWKVSQADVKKVIKALGIKADVVKGNCSYYSAESAARIKKALGKS